ncbi:MAG TPA: 3D domain-containing protein [Gaiellaceae bacterium]|nr:3D domain-containing protein [Gaiellaceae bacterium]
MRTLAAAALCGTAVGGLLAAAGGAQGPADLQAQADALRARNDALAAGSQNVLASLTAIESRLAQARAELASFRARSAKVRAQRREAMAELRIVRASLRLSQDALARRLQTLYEQGNTDVLAVILGAGSLDEALSAVETIDLAARQDEDLLDRARSSSRRLARLGSALAAKQRELDQLAAAKAAATASLVDARAERLRTIASIRTTRAANAGAIARLDARARTLASVPAAPPTPVVAPGAPSLPAGPASEGVRSLTVLATAYALPGTTASGRPVGWGVVAVDPSVIPLGSRLAIPGYGMGVAADTGGAITGARIDLWFPSLAQAHEWGSRTVTVTVYPN